VVSAFDLPELDAKASKTKLNEYARKTYVSVEFLEDWLERKASKGQSLPRAICGIPVEVKGEVWGVIVIDSRNPGELYKDAVMAFWKTTARTLSKLLEKA